VIPIRNLNGHNIGPYQIHAGKTVPLVKGGSQEKMEEGEHYAIETFATTGSGKVWQDLQCSHFMRDFNKTYAPLRHHGAKKLLRYIDKTYNTLCFCRRWLDQKGQKR